MEDSLLHKFIVVHLYSYSELYLNVPVTFFNVNLYIVHAVD